MSAKNIFSVEPKRLPPPGRRSEVVEFTTDNQVQQESLDI